MNLENYNLIWGIRGNHTFTQEELDKELKENPNLFRSYYAQERVAIKYNSKDAIDKLQNDAFEELKEELRIKGHGQI